MHNAMDSKKAEWGCNGLVKERESKTGIEGTHRFLRAQLLKTAKEQNDVRYVIFLPLLNFHP